MTDPLARDRRVQEHNIERRPNAHSTNWTDETAMAGGIPQLAASAATRFCYQRLRSSKAQTMIISRLTWPIRCSRLSMSVNAVTFERFEGQPYIFTVGGRDQRNRK
jgi:hypothetical protein